MHMNPRDEQHRNCPRGLMNESLSTQSERRLMFLSGTLEHTIFELKVFHPWHQEREREGERGRERERDGAVSLADTVWLRLGLAFHPWSKSIPLESRLPPNAAPSIRFWKTLYKLTTIDGWLILHQQQLIGDPIKWRSPLTARAAIWRLLRNVVAAAAQGPADDKQQGDAARRAQFAACILRLIREQSRLWRQTLGVNVQLKYSTLVSPGGAPTVPGLIKFSSAIPVKGGTCSGEREK